MRRFAFAAALSLTVFGAAAADPIEQRKQNMKERGEIMRVLGPVAQGKTDFDAGTVQEALQALDINARAAGDVDTVWPQGSDSGDTRALPAIWADFEAFRAADAEYDAAVAAAAAAAPQDLAAFQAVFAPVARGCGACHENYRRPQ